MDTNEYFNQNQMTITPEIKEYLRESAKWGKFLSIIGFVMMALLIIFALFIGTVMAALGASSEELGGMAAMGTGFLSFIYILMALIYFFPLLYLYRFSTKVKEAIELDDQHYLTEAFQNMKSLFKFMGIFTAVIVGIYALIFAFALLGGMASLF